MLMEFYVKRIPAPAWNVTTYECELLYRQAASCIDLADTVAAISTESRVMAVAADSEDANARLNVILTG
ncbi:hypothetical protein SAMN04487969_1052 [Paenibacillus algorifonticola]|uniref:Uncharacterized protein n=1 Tax=Paenibacillus algorifonticola TaxID=684063 RepID=A0A1I2CCU9_9BACL|nr:hypothetical protein SAMN04487969_1052 [Paenibacillus algorifonticola]